MTKITSAPLPTPNEQILAITAGFWKSRVLAVERKRSKSLRVHSMSTESMKQNIGEKFLIALRSRDWELMRTITAPDIVWSLPGSSRISGQAHGVDAVIARCQLITSYGLNFGLKHVLYGQFGFALSLHNTARRGDLVLDEHLATVCSLREDKISRIDTYLSDVSMANAFFA